jgi:hypothetical protein
LFALQFCTLGLPHTSITVIEDIQKHKGMPQLSDCQHLSDSMQPW